jgi:hypothetical protein
MRGWRTIGSLLLSIWRQRVDHLLHASPKGLLDVLTQSLLDVICSDVGSVSTRKFYGIAAEKECLHEPILQIGVYEDREELALQACCSH